MEWRECMVSTDRLLYRLSYAQRCPEIQKLRSGRRVALRRARRADLRMVAQILLDGLVPQDETEAALRVDVDGLL
jgi:hypothetical protein